LTVVAVAPRMGHLFYIRSGELFQYPLSDNTEMPSLDNNLYQVSHVLFNLRGCERFPLEDHLSLINPLFQQIHRRQIGQENGVCFYPVAKQAPK